MINLSKVIAQLEMLGYSEKEINLALEYITGKKEPTEQWAHSILDRMSDKMSQHDKFNTPDYLNYTAPIRTQPDYTVSVPDGMIPGSAELPEVQGIINSLRDKAAGTASDYLKSKGINMSPKTITGITSIILSSVGSYIKTEGFEGGGGQGTSGGDQSPFATVKFPGTGFDYQPKPLEIRYDVPIPNTVYGEVGVRPSSSESDYKSRLHLSCVSTNLPSYNESDFVSEYFDTVFRPNLAIKAQNAVSFNISGNNLFTTTNLKNYYNIILKACDIYYFFAHTYAYCSISENRNQGMFILRDLFQTADIQRLRLLEERLNGMAIPNRINEFTYWKNSTYRTSSVAGSDLLKMCPVGFNISATNGAVTSIQGGANLLENLLDELSGTANEFQRISDLLARVCPQWLATKVGASFGLPAHDPNFTTFFANSPLTHGNTNVINVPSVSFNNDDVGYTAFEEELNGLTQSMCSIHDTINWNGWLKPIISTGMETSDANTNRFSMVRSGNTTILGNYGFYIGQLPYLRPEQNIIRLTGAASRVAFSKQVPDGVPVLGVNVNSNQQAAINALGWLLDIGAVGSSAPFTGNRVKEDPTDMAMPRKSKRRRK